MMPKRVFAMRFKLFSFFLALSVVAGCAPYKMDIRQGNFVTPEMRERLKVGMSHNQVRALLGTPLVTDVLHPERWDYVYTYEHKRQLQDKQRLTLYFTGDSLTRIDDSHMPPMPAPTPATGATP
jgi:outer membrane protein assembly factor BamE